MLNKNMYIFVESGGKAREPKSGRKQGTRSSRRDFVHGDFDIGYYCIFFY